MSGMCNLKEERFVFIHASVHVKLAPSQDVMAEEHSRDSCLPHVEKEAEHV